MNPVIALVGRPNVGKSTLFNRLTRSRDALVADIAGLTRDRKYGAGAVGERNYIVVDTGGISGMEQGLDERMAQQSFLAIEEADIVLFLVDARAGVTGADRMIAEHLRTKGKRAYLVVNKIDGLNPDTDVTEFHEMGLGNFHTIAAAHNRGVTQLIEQVLAELPPEFQVAEGEEGADPLTHHGIRISVVGRPNVGKSTLVNRMLGEERVVVFDQAGTTMDSIYIPYTRHDKPYTLIDTAGVRRRRSVHETAEKFSIIKTLQAISDAHVCILVLDARDGIVEQDLTMLSFVLNSGRALVIAVNKWDGMELSAKEYVKKELERRLTFIDWAEIHFISALHGTGVGLLYDSVEQAHASATTKFPTNQLTRILEDAIMDHQPPLVNGRRVKLRYAHLGGSNPPIIVVHGTQTDKLPDSYKRYLANTFRKVLHISGTPIRFEFKSSANPFAGKKEGIKKPKFIQDVIDKTNAIREAKDKKRKAKKGKENRKNHE